MTEYDVRKVHDCEFCGRQDERLGVTEDLGAAQALADADAGVRLRWRRFDGRFPLSADREDGVWTYYVHERGPA